MHIPSVDLGGSLSIRKLLQVSTTGKNQQNRTLHTIEAMGGGATDPGEAAAKSNSGALSSRTM